MGRVQELCQTGTANARLWAVLGAAMSALLAAVALGPAAPPDSEPLTIESALAQARAANARLPVAAAEVAIAQQREEEARAERWLKISAEGDFVYAPRDSYDPILTNLGEERLQLVGRQPLFDGGGRRAAVARAAAELAGSRARYRIDEKDLELDVRSRFAEILETDAEIEGRRGAIERLKGYRTSLESRKASGQGIAADLLKTDVRLAADETDLLDAVRRRDEARMELDDLMGRDPAEPLALEAASFPDEADTAPGDAWQNAPEITEAQAKTLSAAADLLAARSERRPHLSLGADVGLWGSDTTRLIPPDLEASHPHAGFSDRVRRDAGYSLNLSFSWPLWDHGAAKARAAAAAFALEASRLEETVAQRRARLAWELAREAMDNLSRQIETLRRAAPDARDSFLEAESRYRGGAASALEVLDAYSSWVDASVRLAEVTMRHRIARAAEIRWGRP